MEGPASRQALAHPAAALFAGLLMLGAPRVAAQSPDSAQALLIQRPVPTPDAALTDLPGVFSWSFRSAGWPEAPAPYGVDPASVDLSVDDHSYDDLVTGRPRYDLAPSVLLTGGRFVGAQDARFRTDRLAVEAPLTRLRYTSTGDGLQEARVLHVQDRMFPGASPPDSGAAAPRLNLLFGYEGAGAGNEYPGSRLQRARRVIGRAAIRGETWQVSVQNVANRRRIGAHGGVEPIPGRGYESIFQRLGAVVTDEDHARRTIRNDLTLTGSGRRGAVAASAAVFWSSQTHSFDDGLSLTRWEVHRYGGRAGVWSIQGEQLAFGLDANAALERPGGFVDSLVTGGVGMDGRLLGGAGAEARVRLKGAAVDLRAGAALDDDRVYPDLSIMLDHDRVNASVSFAGRTNPWIDHAGFFDFAPAFAEPPDVRTLAVVLSVPVHIGILTVEPRAALVREDAVPVRMLGNTATTSIAGTLSGPATGSTLTVRLGLNDAAEHGPYVVLSPTVHAADLDERSELDRAWLNAVPDAWVDGRVGYRRLMFKGDLDLDLYVRGRAWTDMRGRRLHTPTGLLMLAPDDARTVGSSGLVDIVAEGRVRGAVLILAWENGLSGTSAQAGNLLVPDYPLPAQRLRFGVYWPISN